MMSVSGSLGRWQVVNVQGDLDLATVPGVRLLFNDLTRAGRCRILLDLEGIGFIDSSGIGVLIGAQRRLQQVGGELRVVASKRGIAGLFRMTGLSAAIAVYQTMADAELDLAGTDCEHREPAERHPSPSVRAGRRPTTHHRERAGQVASKGRTNQEMMVNE
jgi:anti-sigma B factor antagonist